MAAALSNLWWGFHKVITNTLFGIVSLLIFFGKKIEAFCKREITAAFIITTIILALSIGWLATFLHTSAQLHTPEHQRDSISIKYDRVMQPYRTKYIQQSYDIQGADAEMD
jgi:hypothetical protein